MEFMKVEDDEVALAAIGKHARLVMKKYAANEHMKYWGVLNAYALFCITEGKLMVKSEWTRAMADFKAYEKWQSTSGLSLEQMHVLNKFPVILQYILQQESRTKLRADLPRITEAYVLEQYAMLRRLLRDAADVLKLKHLDEKDAELGDMVKEIARDMRVKSSAKVMKRLDKHLKDCYKFIDESERMLQSAQTVPATPNAAALLSNKSQSPEKPKTEKSPAKVKVKSPAAVEKKQPKATEETKNVEEKKNSDKTSETKPEAKPEKKPEDKAEEKHEKKHKHRRHHKTK